MSKRIGLRPKLSPPKDRLLQRSYKPWRTCVLVTGCVVVLVCVVFGLTAYNLYDHRFKTRKHFMHTGDEMSLREASKDLSSIFCSAYSVDSYGQGKFYLLPHKGRLSLHERVNVTFNSTATPGPRVYVTRTHYLNRNSTVSLTACHRDLPNVTRPFHDDSAEILVVVGDDHYKEWKKHFNIRHVRHRVPVPGNATCTGVSPLPQIHFIVPHAENFYFVIATQLHSHIYHRPQHQAQVVLTGALSKTQLNVSDAEQVCSFNETTCVFPLKWGREEDVVGVMRLDPDGGNAAVNFDTTCRERLLFWLPVFVGGPLFLVAFMSVCCWCVLVKRQNISAHYQRLESTEQACSQYGSMNSERSPLLEESPEILSESNGVVSSIQDS